MSVIYLIAVSWGGGGGESTAEAAATASVAVGGGGVAEVDGCTSDPHSCNS
jgi:hypothetical protein